MRLLPPVLVIATALALAGCSSAPAAEPDTAPSATPTEAGPTFEPAPELADGPRDITSKAVDAVGDVVSKATVDDDDWFQAWLTMANPRVEGGSPEAVEAKMLCEDLVGHLGLASGRIYESDGTLWFKIIYAPAGPECHEF